MEKNYLDTNLSCEKAADIFMEICREILKQIHYDEVNKKIREKFPEVTEDQWMLFLKDDYNLSHETDEGIDKMFEELNFKQFLTETIESITNPDEESTKIEE